MPKIRELIAAQKDIKFDVKDDEGWFGTKFPEGVDELHFAVAGVIKDVDRLKLLYDLFRRNARRAVPDRSCQRHAAWRQAEVTTPAIDD